jgi:DNA-binding NtrC family response regulator
MAEATILIIDDDAHIRETVQLALEEAGYQVETAASGPAGLAKFGNGENWDLVLLDQRMAEMPGLEVLGRLRQVNRGVPVILLTAYGTIDLAQSVLASGASAFLRKPMSPEELRRIVHDVLASHRRPASVRRDHDQ